MMVFEYDGGAIGSPWSHDTSGGLNSGVALPKSLLRVSLYAYDDGSGNTGTININLAWTDNGTARTTTAKTLSIGGYIEDVTLVNFMDTKMTGTTDRVIAVKGTGAGGWNSGVRIVLVVENLIKEETQYRLL
jgi:hypothetical protein